MLLSRRHWDNEPSAVTNTLLLDNFDHAALTLTIDMTVLVAGSPFPFHQWGS